MNIAPLDWLIIAVMYAAFLGIAFYINSLCKSVSDYLISGRKVRVWLGMGAGVAGEIGLVTIVGTCEQGYLRGFSSVFIITLTMLVMVPLFGIFGFGIQRFRATKAMSVSQYIEMRYSSRLRVITGFLNSVSGVLQMCIFPIVGARFLRVLIDAPEFFSPGSSIQTAWVIMGILLTSAVIFTFLGGYVTLIVTNFFQSIIIVGVLYWLLFYLIGMSSLQEIWTGLENYRGISGLNPFSGEDGSYGIVFWLWMCTMSILLQFSYGPYLQKYASMDKPKTVSRSYLFGYLFGNGRAFVILTFGVVSLVALGTSQPAGIEIGQYDWSATATPYYLSTVVPVGMMGVLLAGLLFADVATTDQYILSWSTTIVNDCIMPFKKTPFSPTQHIRAVRITIVILCTLFFFVGVTYKPIMPLWEYLWLCVNIIGGTGIAVLFGMYWKRASTAGAYAAVITCTVIPLSDLIARRVMVEVNPETPYPLTPQMIGFSSYVLAAVLLIAISLMSKKPTGYWDLGEAVRQMNQE
jgi:solute:Na+ symporter, SSS family